MLHNQYRKAREREGERESERERKRYRQTERKKEKESKEEGESYMKEGRRNGMTDSVLYALKCAL